MPGPLDGIRVIDLTTMVSGPLGTMILADQGADVVKVENPRGGDHSRQVATRRGGFSASFLNNNRNKRSIALDLKRPEGLVALKRILVGADVLVQNFRPGVAERIGLGEAAVREVAPDIVYVSISGFGEHGPYAHKPVFDPLIQALSGLTTVQAGSDEAPPRLVRTILPDKLTGYAMAQAVCAALLARARGGAAQHVRLSMLDTVLAFLWGSDMGGHTLVGDELEQETAQSFIDLIYETADGYISVAVMRHREWIGLARACERPDWLEDPRFADSEGLDKHRDARLHLTQEALRTRGTDEWLARLEAEDVPCAPVLTRYAAIRHPQVEASEIVVEHEHPQAGRLRQTRPPARFSEAALEIRHPAPLLGGNTRDILAEAGLSDGEIAALIDVGAATQSEVPEGKTA